MQQWDESRSQRVARIRGRRGARLIFAPVVAFGVCTLAALGAPALAAVPAAPRAAHVASTLTLNETGRLHLTSHHGFTLNEQGSATGTIAGTIYIHLNVVSTNHVTAEVNIYPRGGSITGQASASYRPSGAVATFAGTMNVSRGSGQYGHARGSGLSFSGTIQRSSDAVTVRVSGRLSD
jgi:hypothetical protein